MASKIKVLNATFLIILVCCYHMVLHGLNIFQQGFKINNSYVCLNNFNQNLYQPLLNIYMQNYNKACSFWITNTQLDSILKLFYIIGSLLLTSRLLLNEFRYIMYNSFLCCIMCHMPPSWCLIMQKLFGEITEWVSNKQCKSLFSYVPNHHPNLIIQVQVEMSNLSQGEILNVKLTITIPENNLLHFLTDNYSDILCCSILFNSAHVLFKMVKIFSLQKKTLTYKKW